MIRHEKKEKIPERKDPGDDEPEFCSPGSIEQKLDMCETGSLRGDEVLHQHGASEEFAESRPRALDRVIGQFNEDLSEESREGDEMSGDEHSAGLQGGEPELQSQPHIESGMPGDRTRRQEETERSDIEGAEIINEEAEGIPKRPPDELSGGHERRKKKKSKAA